MEVRPLNAEVVEIPTDTEARETKFFFFFSFFLNFGSWFLGRGEENEEVEPVAQWKDTVLV